MFGFFLMKQLIFKGNLILPVSVFFQPNGKLLSWVNYISFSRISEKRKQENSQLLSHMFCHTEENNTVDFVLVFIYLYFKTIALIKDLFSFWETILISSHIDWASTTYLADSRVLWLVGHGVCEGRQHLSSVLSCMTDKSPGYLSELLSIPPC